ncbi:unnamed protein product [Chrysoparadoxa australica]
MPRPCIATQDKRSEWRRKLSGEDASTLYACEVHGSDSPRSSSPPPVLERLRRDPNEGCAGLAPSIQRSPDAAELSGSMKTMALEALGLSQLDQLVDLDTASSKLHGRPAVVSYFTALCLSYLSQSHRSNHTAHTRKTQLLAAAGPSWQEQLSPTAPLQSCRFPHQTTFNMEMQEKAQFLLEEEESGSPEQVRSARTAMDWQSMQDSAAISAALSGLSISGLSQYSFGSFNRDPSSSAKNAQGSRSNMEVAHSANILGSAADDDGVGKDAVGEGSNSAMAASSDLELPRDEAEPPKDRRRSGSSRSNSNKSNGSKREGLWGRLYRGTSQSFHSLTRALSGTSISKGSASNMSGKTSLSETFSIDSGAAALLHACGKSSSEVGSSSSSCRLKEALSLLVPELWKSQHSNNSGFPSQHVCKVETPTVPSDTSYSPPEFGTTRRAHAPHAEWEDHNRMEGRWQGAPPSEIGAQPHEFVPPLTFADTLSFQHHQQQQQQYGQQFQPMLKLPQQNVNQAVGPFGEIIAPQMPHQGGPAPVFSPFPAQLPALNRDSFRNLNLEQHDQRGCSLPVAQSLAPQFLGGHMKMPLHNRHYHHAAAKGPRPSMPPAGPHMLQRSRNIRHGFDMTPDQARAQAALAMNVAHSQRRASCPPAFSGTRELPHRPCCPGSPVNLEPPEPQYPDSPTMRRIAQHAAFGGSAPVYGAMGMGSITPQLQPGQLMQPRMCASVGPSCVNREVLVDVKPGALPDLPGATPHGTATSTAPFNSVCDEGRSAHCSFMRHADQLHAQAMPGKRRASAAKPKATSGKPFKRRRGEGGRFVKALKYISISHFQKNKKPLKEFEEFEAPEDGEEAMRKRERNNNLPVRASPATAGSLEMSESNEPLR